MKARSFVLGLGRLLACACHFLAAAAENPPLPPAPESPVAVFRKLLALPADDRAAALRNRNERQREFLLARCAEYEALPPATREQRLRATDLYWHLQQLLPRDASEREPILAAAPGNLKVVLAERLALWDQLPAADRAILLQDGRAIRYFASVPTAAPPALPGAGMTAAPRVPLRLQAELAQLDNLSAEARKQLQEKWTRFFETPPERARRAIQEMSAAERAEMRDVLEKFRALPPAQRRTCIASFARLATMPASERAAFLRSAERWEALPPEERAAWRKVVTMLPPLPPTPENLNTPPLPPDVGGPVTGGAGASPWQPVKTL